MCLKYDTFSKTPMFSGVGFKVVRTTDAEDRFLPFYSHFGESVRKTRPTDWQGTYGMLVEGKETLKSIKTAHNFVATDAVYTLNKRHVVKHGRKTCTMPGLGGVFETYPAGVSLHKNAPLVGPYLICEYRNAVAEDDEDVVAMQIIPRYYVQPANFLKVEEG